MATVVSNGTSGGRGKTGSASSSTATATSAAASPLAPGGRSGKDQQQQPLYVRFPVNTSWELTVKCGSDEQKVSGRVYCTDEISGTVVLQKALPHTTLSSEVRVLHAHSITGARQLSDSGSSSTEQLQLQPLPKIQKKALEERERRAMNRLADDGFLHINQKATPEGQSIFDRLLKACSQVVWKGESILVLNQVQVDPPYGPDNCKIIQRSGGGGGGGSNGGALEDGSLDRVKKIVAASL